MFLKSFDGGISKKFNLKVHKLQDTFLGTWTRATCLLRVPWAGPWAVDNFRHWNFSICSKNVGVMAISMEGSKPKNFKKIDVPAGWRIVYIFGLLPSFEMAITPTLIEQIEKFQCLKLSTAQGPAHGTLRRHVARVTCPQTCLEASQLFCPKSPKTLHVWFGVT